MLILEMLSRLVQGAGANVAGSTAVRTADLEAIRVWTQSFAGLSPLDIAARLADQPVHFCLAHNTASGSNDLTYIAATSDGKGCGIASVGSRMVAGQLAFGLMQHLGGIDGIALPEAANPFPQPEEH